jgi:hypothetical protein
MFARFLRYFRPSSPLSVDLQARCVGLLPDDPALEGLLVAVAATTSLYGPALPAQEEQASLDNAQQVIIKHYGAERAAQKWSEFVTAYERQKARDLAERALAAHAAEARRAQRPLARVLQGITAAWQRSPR